MNTKTGERGHEQGPRLLSAACAAEQLGVSERHLRNLAARGYLKTIRLGRRVLVPRVEIDRLASEGTS